jgi:hypothetical protein
VHKTEYSCESLKSLLIKSTKEHEAPDYSRESLKSLLINSEKELEAPDYFLSSRF